jgi:adenosylcobinamide-phosphate synthase
MTLSRAAGLLLGMAADRRWGDPRRGHPVALFGTAATALERRLYADSRRRGAVYTATAVGACVAVGLVAERATSGRPLLHTLATAAATWTVLGGRSLEREALHVATFLDAGDLTGARHRLTYLVGRDTGTLSENEIARAVVESVAENTSDAVTAPLWWGAVAGLPGLLGYRAANTLDAMVGHKTERYLRFGWASARFDDLVNLPGSRFGGVMVLLTHPEGAARALTAWRRDARSHPSPNAGVIESCFAGVLGIQLGGVNRYGSGTESRALMGRGPAPEPKDIGRAVAVATRTDTLAAVVAAGAAAVLGRTAQRKTTRRRGERR